MSKTVDELGDVAFFLYLTPFIATFLYTMYLWVQSGISPVLPQLVFLEVTQSPYLFLVGIVAVTVAGVLDVNDENPATRKAAVAKLSLRLQTIALVSIVLAVVAAVYSSGGDLGNAFFNLLDGRYPLVFPALLVLMSFLILPALDVRKLDSRNAQSVAVVVLLLASPAALHEVGKVNPVAGLASAFALLLAAAAVFLRAQKR